jgi:small basic protein (TIGR04137 family)
MSLDRSLKSASALVRHRNVLTRAERLEKLAGDGKWTEDKGPFGLPKVGHRKMALVKVKKEEAADGAAPAAGGAAAPAAGGKAPAGKGAAPAAGGKAAAPAGGGGAAAKAAAPAGKGAKK